MRLSNFLFLFLLPIFAFTQGVQFETALTWQQVKEKARQENKYIFVNCAASWCVPCKRMEKEVFPLKSIGNFVNANFISLHVQMDTSVTDDEFIKSWYSEAHSLQREFNVTSFPTYMFYSPEGKIVHRYYGAMPDTLFLKVTANALNPEKQYYTLLKAYKEGKKDYNRMMYLANVAIGIGDDSIAKIIAKDYLHNFMNKLTEKELLQKKYLEFIQSFASQLGSEDKIFKVIYKQSIQVDQIMGRNKFAEIYVLDVITREEIIPKLWPNRKPIATDPQWDQLTSRIKLKYNRYYTELAVLNAQLRWYDQKQDTANIIKYMVKKFDNYGLDTAGLGWVGINNTAYELFFHHCSSKDTLYKVIDWMKVINEAYPNDKDILDTYANLLFKVGRVTDAIFWEQKALTLEKNAALKQKRDADPIYQETLDKMKKGIPTWKTE